MKTTAKNPARKAAIGTSVFNARLFFEAVKRLRVIGIAVAILALTVSILVPSITWISAKNSYERRLQSYYEELIWYESMNAETMVGEKPGYVDPDMGKPEKPEITEEPVEAGLLCLPLYAIPFFAPFFFLVLFSFLHKRKESDFYHAIPYTRTCVYVSFVSAALAFVFAIQIVSVLISGAIYAACPFTTYDFGSLVEITVASMLSATLLSAFMMLSLSVTGTGATTMLLFGLFASITRIVLGLFSVCIDELMLVSSSYYPYLSPYWYLPLRIFVQRSREGIPPYSSVLPYTLVTALLLFALAGFLYKTRRSEMAERSAPSRLMQSVFRCLFTLPFALIIATMLLTGETDFELLLVLLAITLLAFYLYELVTTKRPKNMLRATPWLGVVAGGAAVFMLTFGAFSLTVHRVIPEEDIDAVSVSVGSTNQFESVVTENIMTEDDRMAALVHDALEDTAYFSEHGFYTGNARYVHHTVSIRKANGVTVKRNLYFTEENSVLLLQYLTESEEYREKYLEIPKSDTLSAISISVNGTDNYYGMYLNNRTKLTHLWKLFTKEYNDLSAEEKLAFKKTAFLSDSKYPAFPEYSDNSDASITSHGPFYILLNIHGTLNGTEYHCAYSIPYSMPNTISYLFETIAKDGFGEYYNRALDTATEKHYFSTDTHTSAEIGNALFTDLATHFTDKEYRFDDATVSFAAYGEYEINLDIAGNEAKYTDFFRLLAEYAENAKDPRAHTLPVMISANMYECIDSTYTIYDAHADVRFVVHLTEADYRALLAAAGLLKK